MYQPMGVPRPITREEVGVPDFIGSLTKGLQAYYAPQQLRAQIAEKRAEAAHKSIISDIYGAYMQSLLGGNSSAGQSISPSSESYQVPRQSNQSSPSVGMGVDNQGNAVQGTFEKPPEEEEEEEEVGERAKQSGYYPGKRYTPQEVEAAKRIAPMLLFKQSPHYFNEGGRLTEVNPGGGITQYQTGPTPGQRVSEEAEAKDRVKSLSDIRESVPQLQASLEDVNKMIDIAKKHPNYFGPGLFGYDVLGPSWRGRGVVGHEKDYGAFQDLLNKLVGRQSLATSGGNRVLASALAFTIKNKPSFGEYQEGALGKLESAKHDMERALNNFRTQNKLLHGNPSIFQTKEQKSAAKEENASTKYRYRYNLQTHKLEKIE